MPINKELDQLLADAGLAATDERRREEDARARRERELAEHVAAEAQAQRDAPSNAETIWSWVMSAEVEDLRATMRDHGVDRVRLGGAYGILRGEPRPQRSFGSCSLDVLAHAPAIFVTITRGYHGNRARLVASAAELLALMPDRALATVADEVREGKALDLVARGLAASAK